MTKILIVEDDFNLQKELRILLLNNGYEVEVLTTFDNTLEDILKINPDLLLLDIQIPNLHGEFILKNLRKASNIPVIIVTSCNTSIDEVVCMSYGADDYVTKPYHPQILLLRMEAILKRLKPVLSTLTYKNIKLNLSKSIIETDSSEIPLSKNELRIFSYLLEHIGTIVSRENLMNYLWDTDQFIDDNTLTVNINRLRSKLEEIGLIDVIETKRGLGYLLV